MIWEEGLPMPQVRARPGVARVVQNAALVRRQPAKNANPEVWQAVPARREVWQQAVNANPEMRLPVPANQAAHQRNELTLFSLA